MSDTSPAISFAKEEWRTFFLGKLHQAISVSLSEAYAEIFKFCVKSGLLLEPEKAIASVSYKDINDLSHTTGLMHLRYLSVLKVPNGNNRECNLSQLLNTYYRENKNFLSANESSDLRLMLRLCREFENISNILKMGRNLNAHIQSEILDSGFTLQICAAILRLYEIFDYTRVSKTNIDLIRSKASEIILSGFELETANKNKIEKSANWGENPEVAKNLWSEEERSLPEIEKPLARDVDSEEIDVPLDVELKSTELRRQKLQKFKLEIYDFIHSEDLKIDKKFTLLYGSNLSDILAYKPKTIEQLKSVFSVELLLSKNALTTEKQIEIFGQKIVELFA